MKLYAPEIYFILKVGWVGRMEISVGSAVLIIVAVKNRLLSQMIKL